MLGIGNNEEGVMVVVRVGVRVRNNHHGYRAI